MLSVIFTRCMLSVRYGVCLFVVADDFEIIIWGELTVYLLDAVRRPAHLGLHARLWRDSEVAALDAMLCYIVS